jgi:hypothetical protein
MVGRVLGSLVAVIAVSLALAGCSTSIAGSAVPAAGSSAADTPVARPSATQVCGKVPAALVEQLFGVSSVQITVVGQPTTQQGIYQVQCLVTGTPELTVNLVYAAAGSPYTPSSALAAIRQQSGISKVEQLTGVGTAQQAIQYSWQNQNTALSAVSGAEQADGGTQVFTLYMPAAKANGGAALVKLLAALFT